MEALTVVVNKFLFAVLLAFPVASMGREQVIAINKVSVDVDGCMRAPELELLFSCHRFGPGDGLGVGFRRYWPAKHTDDDAFEKLTVYFKNKPVSGEVDTLPNKNVFVFYSVGPSSFPGKHGCYGAPQKGTIKAVSINDDSVRLDVDLDFDSTSPTGWITECKKSHVAMRMDARYIKFNELDSWYGSRDSSTGVWDEARP
jgi:hypothetical protein